ncbi:NBR1-Ig-like domain-containing protein [Vitiosangium sp. GDMCC 1.1324]|uniref:NBR1-Ig-like domain-containing protein n=1 Tax=Vitiosangium sp. (strain GDMCC 1.1324) TaxID=2138576 RepID=UPI00130E15D0|nr:NBR1-Ig-like domain-containing protein [Vitiosangium sp. GDMCC 1.1324]
MGHERFNRVCRVALAAAMLSACEGAGVSGADESPQSDRTGIGMVPPPPSTEPAPAPVPLDALRSLAVTEKNILARFGGRRVFSKLVADNAGAGFTADQLFRQLWDTQNPAPGQPDLPGMPHCTDNGNTLNDFPYVCRPSEGGQARPTSVINLDSYAAVGLYNRFDLAPVDGSDCGQYRIVLARLPFSPASRNFIIFESVLPNPHPELGLEGCRPVVRFWSGLSADADPMSRADKLEAFYFSGLPGFAPVVSMNHFGNNPRSLGQVRTNQFLQGPPGAPPVPWMMHEFKLVTDCTAQPSCTLKFVPATVKTNPFGGLFNPASTDPRASAFQSYFLTQVAGLAVNDLNRFNYAVPDSFNAAQDDSRTPGGADDYLAQFGPGPSAFHRAIGDELTRLGSTLTPHDIVARAQALSCGGCHQRNSGRPVGGGLTWPASANFVHSTETDDPADPGRFAISPALRNQFLPLRKTVLESYLQSPPLDASFVRQSVPTTVRAGQTFQVSLTLSNTGTTAWSEPNAIQLRAASGTPEWAVASVPLAPGELVHRGSERTFTFDVQAPSTPGVHVFQRVMTSSGAGFGQATPPVQINITP